MSGTHAGMTKGNEMSSYQVALGFLAYIAAVLTVCVALELLR